MNTISTYITRPIFMGGDLGQVEVQFEIHIDRTNAAIIAVAEGVTGFMVLRDHPIGPALIAVRDANLGYREAVNAGGFDGLATFLTRTDVGLAADFPTEIPPTIALPIPDWDDEGDEPDDIP